MISSLKGKVSRLWGNFVEIEVGGVGYLVWVGRNNYTQGQELKLSIHMSVSENEVALYGFENFEELDLFKMLITVSGVGPKSAAQILVQCKSIEIVKAIGDANTGFFEKIKGVGKKTAQRIIIDLKSKIGGLGELNLKDEYPLLEDDLVLSLRQLGFERREIESVTKKIPKEVVILEERISWCLQNLGK